MKLLRKLLSRIILLVLLTSSVIGGVSLYVSSTSIHDLTMKQVEDQLNLRTALIEEKMASTTRMLELLGSDSDVIKALTYNKIDTGVIESFTAAVDNNSDLFTLVSLIDRNGIILLSDANSAEKVVGLDLSAREYLQDAIKTGETVVSELIVSNNDGSLSIAICSPMYNGDLYVGSIVSTIKFDVIADLIDDVVIGKDGYAFIIDILGENAGLTVDHKNPDLIMKANLYDLEIPALSKLADKMVSQETGEGFYTYKGDEKYVQFRQFGNWALAITANSDDLDSTADEILKLTIFITIISVLIASAFSYLVVHRYIIKHIKVLESSMGKAGMGDLTHEVTIRTKDEIESLGNSYNLMLSNQKDILRQIGTISGDLSASAEELSASSEEVNESATEVSTNIQDMMQNIMNESEEMKSVQAEVSHLNDSIDESDAKTQQSKSSCETALDIAKEGRDGVQLSVSSIENISTATTEVIDAFDQLNVHAQKVTGISAVIKTIAEQINLLALNASIEAARAGEAGRGFTVVAEEIRKLAEQTSNESANISAVLGTITNLIEDVNVSVSASKGYVDNGEKTIHSLDGKFLEIIHSFEDLNGYIVNLTEISTNQVKISDDIKVSVNQVSGSTNTNASMAQEISASAEEQAAVTETLSHASEETSKMAEKLNSLLERFTIN